MKKQFGFTLLEVLIAMFVLAIGLLGLASLQVTALQSNLNALFLSRATHLTYSIIEAMRANRQGALNSEYNGAMPDDAPNCLYNVEMTKTPIAQNEIDAWRNMLACTLPEGTGSIVSDGSTITVTVQWNDSRGKKTPSSTDTAISSETKRQLVTITAL
ncbi:type IV pilus assembly protein PilV [Gammaproteobacteria bacterium]